MSSRRLLPYFLILAAACLPVPASSQARRPALWFEGARLIVGDKSPTIESSAFLVEGDSITWVGKKGERQQPANATRVDLTGKTVMPTLIDGHNHIGLVNERDGSNKKANYTRENLIDRMRRNSLPSEKALRRHRWRVHRARRDSGFPTAPRPRRRGASTFVSCTRAG